MADKVESGQGPVGAPTFLANFGRIIEHAKPPYLGFGLGLRPQHYCEILEQDLSIDWFEVVSENYMVPGGQPLQMLDRIRARYPVVLHGVALSIASTCDLNLDYLKSLKDLVKRVEPKWVSDHLCWTGVHGIHLHDLLPIPYTQEALEHVAERVQRVQEVLGCAITLENVSTYVQARHSEMPECEFIAELTRRTGCWLLLDLSNVYVSAYNHGYHPMAFLEGIPPDRLVQFHLAGYTRTNACILDTHDAPISPEVWELYELALRRFGPVSTMIERDDNIPPLSELARELERARSVAHRCLSRDAQGRSVT